MGTKSASILKLEAYGHRWHVMIDGRGIVYSGDTYASCTAYCRRHSLPYARAA